jgi:hypothetical protein
MTTSVDGVLHRFTTITATSGLIHHLVLSGAIQYLLVARIHEAKERKFASKLTKKGNDEN